MDVMSIAATSISLSQMQTAQAVSVAVTRKAMDQMTQQAACLPGGTYPTSPSGGAPLGHGPHKPLNAFI